MISVPGTHAPLFESAGLKQNSNGVRLRRALLVGTILGAGVMLLPGGGRAQTVIDITSPVTSSGAAVADDQSTSSDNLTITTSANVTSTGSQGIFATRGPGSITITTATGASVTGTNASGIDAQTGGGAINIGGTNGLGGNVSGAVGIYAYSSAGGAVTITSASTSTVTGVNNHGILTDSGAGTTSITANGAVYGTNMGINAASTTGAINIVSSSIVTGNNSYAVSADNSLATVTIGGSGVKSTATNATVISSSSTGIYATSISNGGDNGAIVVLTKGAVTGSGSNFGIYASNAGDNITIGTSDSKITNAVSAFRGAISATTTGTGAISISTGAGGTVTGDTRMGIATSAESGATTLDLGAAVSGGTKGINSSSTTGAISIASTSTVTGNGDYAIYASNTLATVTIGGDGVKSTATNATVQINSTTGIVAKNSGNGGNNGAVTVQTAGAVSSSGIGIEASNAGDSITIGSSAAKITNAISGTQGISAINTGTGTISIATGAGGTVTGTAGNGLTTSAATGATTITLDAAVTGSSGGISSTSTSGDITITTAAVTGGVGGIITNSTAGGATSITFNGDVQSAAGSAIWARGTTGAITIDGSGEASLSNPSNAGGGVAASTTTGAITLSGTGATSGQGGAMVNLAITGASATADITITRSGAYTISNGNAILASNAGSGAINISGLGAVTATGTWSGTGSDFAAIAAKASGGAVNIGGSTGLSNAISSTQQGINASTTGAGTIDIKTVSGGTVTSTGGEGIFTSAGNGTTTINLGANVSGGLGQSAVYAYSTGAANIALTTASGVTVSGGGFGIRAESGTGNIDLGGTTGLGGAVSGTDAGILASTSGTGTINIKTASGGTVSGTSGIGIETYTVNGATTIDVGANVTGDTGIRTDSAGGASTGTTSITIRTGATVTGATRAILAKTGNANVTINNAGTVNGDIRSAKYSTGTGTFTFNHSGTFTLLGSQTNTGFALNNLSGGVLTGTGSFGAVNAASGSIIRPGDRTLAAVGGVPVMGTLNATSLTLASGAIVEVRADYSGVNDKVAVTGAAALGGATLKVLATPQTDATWGTTSKSFTVLTAGSITGAFASAVQTDYAFLTATAAVATDGKSVVATLVRATTPTTTTTTDTSSSSSSSSSGSTTSAPTSFGTYATTTTQKSVTSTLDRFQAQTSNPLIAKVTTLTVAQAPAAFTQLAGTGVTAATTQAFAAAAVFSGAINTEAGKFTGSAGGSSGVLSYASDKKLTKAFDKVAAKPVEPILDGRVWAHVLGGVANMKSDATNPSERSSNYGIAAGADTALTPNLRAGFALSGGQSTTKVSALSTKADATWGQGALYAVATDGDRYAKAALVYGHLTTETERKVTAFATPETAKGKFDSNLYSTRLEVGQRFVTGAAVDLTPFAAFEPSWLVQDSYAETGAATVGLGFGKTTTRALPATLGVKAESDIALDGMRLTPSATLGWVHDFASASSLSPFFTALPGSTFTIAGAKGDRNLARTEVNLEATPTGSTATFYANARADLGARTSAVRGTAGFMMRF